MKKISAPRNLKSFPSGTSVYEAMWGHLKCLQNNNLNKMRKTENPNGVDVEMVWLGTGRACPRGSYKASVCGRGRFPARKCLQSGGWEKNAKKSAKWQPELALSKKCQDYLVGRDDRFSEPTQWTTAKSWPVELASSESGPLSLKLPSANIGRSYY